MPRVAEYTLRIKPGRELDNNYVGMAHEQKFVIELQNHNWLRADAAVTVDGKEVTTVRLAGHGSVTIEGPPDDPARGQFTFYCSGTTAAAAAGDADVAAPDKGLVTVVFRPEKKPEYSKPRGPVVRTMSVQGSSWSSGEPQYGTLRSSNHLGDSPKSISLSEMAAAAEEAVGGAPAGAVAGITGLSGHTDQKWNTVGPLPAYDDDKVVTISVRLIELKDGPRPLLAAKSRTSPVPPPVG
jgi:hypothetical protein